MTDLSIAADRFSTPVGAFAGGGSFAAHARAAVAKELRGLRGNVPQLAWIVALSVAIGVLHLQGLYRPELSANLLFG